MLILGRVGETKIVIMTLVAFAVLIAFVVYLPVALIREATRSEDEVLPEWMGTVKGRRTRLRIVFGILGSFAIAAAAAVAMTE